MQSIIQAFALHSSFLVYNDSVSGSKCPDQAALIRAFDVLNCPKTRYRMTRPIYNYIQVPGNCTHILPFRISRLSILAFLKHLHFVFNTATMQMHVLNIQFGWTFFFISDCSRKTPKTFKWIPNCHHCCVQQVSVYNVSVTLIYTMHIKKA